jgi:hypothetical protein
MAHFVELKQPNGNSVFVVPEQVIRLEKGSHPGTALIRDGAGFQEVQGEPDVIARQLLR